MPAGKDLKLLTIKKTNPELYEKVVAGQLSLHEAYNEAQRQHLGLSEFRGTNSRKKEFTTDFKRIMQLHNPTPEELKQEIKKAFPFTWKEFIKE